MIDDLLFIEAYDPKSTTFQFHVFFLILIFFADIGAPIDLDDQLDAVTAKILQCV
jgi:hypothetical protein